jgi:endonuclease/exonuclease/phosphatase family metal-dependent hydrolase
MTSLSPATQVRVATLNTWGLRGDWSRRQQVLRNGLADLDADLVTLQETIVTGDYDQPAEVLPDEYHRVHSRAREDDGQGITIASRWPLGEAIELDLNVTRRTGDFACTTLITEVFGPAPLGRIILVRCAAHGGPTLRIRRCRRTFDTPASTVSDHYGLVADLVLATAPE